MKDRYLGGNAAVFQRKKDTEKNQSQEYPPTPTKKPHTNPSSPPPNHKYRQNTYAVDSAIRVNSIQWRNADDLAEDSPQDNIVLEWLFYAMFTVIAAFTIIDD